MQALKYYLKEIVQNPIYDPTGKAIPFEPLAEGYGVCALSGESEQDRVWIEVLESCIKKRIGGVVPIDQVEYSKKKKSLPFSPRSPESPLRVFQSSQSPQQPRVSNAADNGRPAMDTEPSFVIGENRQTAALPTAAELAAPSAENFTPRVGRPKKLNLTKSAERALAGAR